MRPGRPPWKSYLTYSRSAGVKIVLAVVLVGSGTSGLTMPASGDEFGSLEGAPLFDLARGPDTKNQAKHHTQLTFRDLEALPQVLRDERAALVIVKTDLGNVAKMLVSPGFRKLRPSEKDGPLVPVLVVERFETIDAGDRRSLKARGKELTLFDGFRFDLDSGQVVPEGLGGDIVFLTMVPDGPRLAVLSGSGLLTLEKPIPSPAPAPGKPSGGRAILPTDFGGRYNLMANGQWSGTLNLAVDPAGVISGHFRSDRNGSAYPVTGQVATDVPQKASFTVQFPRARQVYEGFLWTEGKNAIAGTLSMLDHPYGFIAIREGASLATETIDLSRAPDTGSRRQRRVVRLETGSAPYTLDGQARSESALLESLSQAVRADAATAVLLRVSDTVTYARVRHAIGVVRVAGVKSLELGLATDKGDSD